MGPTVKTTKYNRSLWARSQDGFTLIEVMIAMVILMVGLLSLLAMFAGAIATTQFSQQELIAKQKAREALESVYSARNDSRVAFAQIDNNCGPTAGTGIFACGWDNLVRLAPAGTGILGANAPGFAEGVCTPTTGIGCDFLLAPAANGQLTVQVPLTNFLRQIQIAPYIDPVTGPNPNLKKITVTVRVTNNGIPRDYVVSGYISAYN